MVDNEATWYLFEELGKALSDLEDEEALGRAQRIMSALTATAGDVLRGSRRNTAQHGALKAKHLLDDLRAVDRGTDQRSRLLGSLATLTDLLGLAATRRVPDNVEAIARGLLPILRVLESGPLSNKDVAEKLGITVETACRSLREARTAHLVEVERHGRLAMNRLSDLAYALDEAGVIALAADGWSMQSYLAATPLEKSPSKAGRSVPLLQVAEG